MVIFLGSFLLGGFTTLDIFRMLKDGDLWANDIHFADLAELETAHSYDSY